MLPDVEGRPLSQLIDREAEASFLSFLQFPDLE